MPANVDKELIELVKTALDLFNAQGFADITDIIPLPVMALTGPVSAILGRTMITAPVATGIKLTSDNETDVYMAGIVRIGESINISSIFVTGFPCTLKIGINSHEAFPPFVGLKEFAEKAGSFPSIEEFFESVPRGVDYYQKIFSKCHNPAPQ